MQMIIVIVLCAQGTPLVAYRTLAAGRLSGGADLNHADEAVARVQQRVRQGGHHIPEDVIRRRFEAGLMNFHRHYAPVVDQWVLYNNAGDVPILLDWSKK